MKKNKLRQIPLMLILFTVSISTNALGQMDTSRKTHAYNIRIGIDDNKGRIIRNINDDYKKGVKEVINSSILTPNEKRIRIDLLIKVKNQQLAKILNREQLGKIIPTTEMASNKMPRVADSTTKENRFSYIKNLLLIDDRKAIEVQNILTVFDKDIQNIVNNKSLTQQSKGDQINLSTENRDRRLSRVLTVQQINALIPGKIKNNTIMVNPRAGVVNTQYKETIAIQDTFNSKLKNILADKSISPQERIKQIDLLVKQKNNSLNAFYFRTAILKNKK